MNADVLDRLLMDRALGVLAPDVETLLGAYLEREPDAARRVAEYADATGLAGRLLKVGGAKPLPPFPEAKLREAEVARRRRRIVRQVASLAACVLVGVWAGAWWGGTAGVEPAPGPRTTNPVVVDAGSSGDDAGFWSLERLSETVQQKKRTRPVLFKWDSPMRKPTMGETT